MKYYDVDAMPFYFDLIPVTRDSCKTSLAECYLKAIEIGLNTSGRWPNFVASILNLFLHCVQFLIICLSFVGVNS